MYEQWQSARLAVTGFCVKASHNHAMGLFRVLNAECFAVLMSRRMRLWDGLCLA